VAILSKSGRFGWLIAALAADKTVAFSQKICDIGEKEGQQRS